MESKIEEVPIRPETAARLAWSLTLAHSGSKTVGELYAQRPHNLMDDIKKQAEKSGREQDIKYVDNLYVAIYACLRGLVTIINGRNLNYKEIDELRDKQRELIKSLSTFTINTQTLLPRLIGPGAITLAGGLTISELLVRQFPKVSPYSLYIGLITALALAYFTIELAIVPRLVRRAQKIMVENDYERNLYYRQYVERSKLALTSLLDEALGIYKKFYGDYEIEDKDSVIDEIVAGIAPSQMGNYKPCKYIEKCYWDEEEILTKRWPVCETGIGSVECPVYKNREKEIP